MGMDCPYLAELWKRVVGLDEHNDRLPPLAVLRRTEWSEEFEQAMRVRLIVGAFRYGRLQHGGPRAESRGKPAYDRIGSIVRRIEMYRKTKNKEALVDIANLCLCEFVEGDGEFKPVDDGEHVRRLP